MLFGSYCVCLLVSSGQFLKSCAITSIQFEHHLKINPQTWIYVRHSYIRYQRSIVPIVCQRVKRQHQHSVKLSGSGLSCNRLQSPLFRHTAFTANHGEYTFILDACEYLTNTYRPIARWKTIRNIPSFISTSLEQKLRFIGHIFLN